VDPIILLGKYSVLFFSRLSFFLILCSFLFSTTTYARETFEFNLGQKINVLSDKAFRKSRENEFEAIGNVVITHLRNTIYGEKAKINFNTGETEVIGNVRYIAPELTLYGTKLKYNFLSRQIDLDNARVLSEGFVVTGKKILQTSNDIIYGEEAEYTTCKDCPESWSVFGKKITIEIGKYIRIKHAFIKVNGVVAMYFPYIVFPIKQKRESGLLFPLISFKPKEGFQYQQPIFWAIDDFKDATITPSTFGNRGLGGGFQYRQNFKEKTWIELNTLQLKDLVYTPYKITTERSGDQYYRHFSDFEFHSIYSHYFNNHFYVNNTSDLDTVRDLNFFAKDKLSGSEIGGGGFLEGRTSLFSLTTEGYFNKNMFHHDPREFDNKYVQMLPKFSLSSIPFNVVHSHYPFAKNLSFGLNSDYTIFKQNIVDTTGPIRNARRLNLAPYMNWQLGKLGPVFFSHQLKLDYQKYNFPHEDQKHFTKKGLVFATEARVELERVFGLAYIEQRPMEKIDDAEKFKNKRPQTTIGTLPALMNSRSEAMDTIVYNSYRHSQEFKLKHYFLSNQQFVGSDKFKKQIEADSGQFDYVDSIRAKEHVTNQVTARDSLPQSNTFEIQWNNRLIRKVAKSFDPYIDGRYLMDNFEYSNIAYFDVSQGYDQNMDSENKNPVKLVDRLTRLYVNTGFSIGQMNLSAQEFYFHRTSEHKFISSVSYGFERMSLSGNFTYNSFNSSNTPIEKLVGYNLSVSPTDLLTLSNAVNYNLQQKLVTQSSYSILYTPLNNCWKLAFTFARDQIDKKVGLIFYLNYNNNEYTEINVR
jgi:LPS-assembly protein